MAGSYEFVINHKEKNPRSCGSEDLMLMREGKKNYNNHFLPLSVLLQMYTAITKTASAINNHPAIGII